MLIGPISVVPGRTEARAAGASLSEHEKGFVRVVEKQRGCVRGG